MIRRYVVTSSKQRLVLNFLELYKKNLYIIIKRTDKTPLLGQSQHITRSSHRRNVLKEGRQHVETHDSTR